MAENDELKKIQTRIETATPQELEIWLAQLAYQTGCEREKYVKAKEDAKILETAHDIATAIEKRDLIAKGFKISQAAIEVECSEAYIKRIKEIEVARYQKEVTECKSDNFNRSWDTVRSIMSSRNIERKMS